MALKETAGGCEIHIETLNIQLGQEGVLETEPRALQKCNTGIGILQETKLTGGIHTQRRLGLKLSPAQYVLYALILWYVLKTIYLL